MLWQTKNQLAQASLCDSHIYNPCSDLLGLTPVAVRSIRCTTERIRAEATSRFGDTAHLLQRHLLYGVLTDR